MKHPNREEWIPFLFGETTPDAHRRLSEHLADCPECAAEIAGWRRSLKKLETWELPKVPTVRSEVAEPILKWAIAAALVLGFGFGLARLTASAPANLKELRAQLRQELRQELSGDFQRALNHVQNQSSNAFAAAEIRLIQASDVELRRLRLGLLEVLTQARDEDRRASGGLLQKMQQQHEADYISLRKDLETVASLTDEQIRRARLKLIQLAGASQLNEDN